MMKKAVRCVYTALVWLFIGAPRSLMGQTERQQRLAAQLEEAKKVRIAGGSQGNRKLLVYKHKALS